MRDPTIEASGEQIMRLELQGYETREKLGCHDDICFYRLQRYEDGLLAIAKTTRDAYPDEKQVAAFRHEYDLLRTLDGRGALKAYGLEYEGERPVLLLQDIGGSTLDQLIRERGQATDLQELLGIAVAAADSLVRIHREKITLNEISPGHLMVNLGTREAKFADLRLGASRSARSPLSSITDRPDSLLPYISPEQTGRSGASADYRSDFYALGATLYEWLSGKVPFELKDTLDIVYHHLAIKPQPLELIREGIPQMVSEIIAKCLEKSPDARYESAYGLKFDLEKSLKALEGSGTIGKFALAERDVPNRLTIPTRLYGRSREQALLIDALRRAAEGGAEHFEIIGGGGIGKTSFVLKTLQDAASREGTFAKGKFDPNRKAAPYDVWVQAIGELVGQRLTESELEVEVWKLRIMKALESYGQLLIERVPMLELVIGPQPVVPSLPPIEAQRRFHLLLNRFFQLFGRQDRPLILFLDDLQWADEASLQYLNYLLEDRETRHTLIVTAYRDEETPMTHALRRADRQPEERGLTVSRIRLNVLDAADVHRLLGDALRSIGEDRDELVAMLLQKTDGNPLFLKQFLQDLFDGGRIAFDEIAEKWVWDMSGIAETRIADNAAAYISEKLKHLPEPMAHALSRAAFLGSPFAVESLLPFTGLSEDELCEELDHAVREGLLQASSKKLKQYKFEHDRIQQAAYALVSEEERIALHLRIGTALADRMRSGGEAGQFEAVQHLNRAVERFASSDLRRELAELNLLAGLKAKQSTAYETALDYLRRATDLIGEADWERDYNFVFPMYRERAELEFLCSYFAEANELFQLLIAKAATNVDQALVYNLMMQLESTQNNHVEVIELGRRSLALLGFKMNAAPSALRLLRLELRLKWKLRKYPIDSLIELPVMEDEIGRAAITALVNVSSALFFIDKKGWLAATFAMIELTLDRGQTPEASIGFVGYALYHYSFRRLEVAFQWGMLAYEWSKPYPALHAKTIAAFSLCYDSWRKYKPEMLERFSEHAGKVGLESGDLLQGNQSVIINGVSQFQFGKPISIIYERMIAHSGEIRRQNNELLWKQAILLVSMLVRLSGHRAADDPFPIEEVGSEAFYRSVRGDETRIIEELMFVAVYLPGYIFGEYREANEALKRTSELAASRQDNRENVMQYTYEALVWAQLYEDMPAKERSAAWTGLRERRRMLRKYARQCPEDYLHKYLFVKAEMAQIKGKSRQAEEWFALSIEAARTHGHIHDLAMAAESCGKHGLRQGKPHLAKIYLTEAHNAYQQWGAWVKAADMERQYGHLLNAKPESGMERVDYLSVARSAQALSGEMEMNRLLDTLMRLMLQNSGAEYGALLLEHGGKWKVEIHGTPAELRIESIPLEEAANLVPAAIIGYAARTREVVVLEDASEAGMFARNPAVREKRLKSVLCLPIFHQSKPVGLLYMENKLTPNAFTPERLDVLKLFGSQCAISIANAKLYSDVQELKNNLERQVEERTRSLERSMLETSAALAEVSVYEERSRIAQEIHDIVGHTLTSTVIQIEAGKRLIRKDAEEAAARLREAQDLVRHGLNEIRGSVHMLKEDKYANLGDTLGQLIRDTERNMGVVIQAEIEDFPDLPASHKKMFYYALQEGLTNGIRHGGSLKFRFHLNDADGAAQFRLQDYGKGASKIAMGFGLKAMKDRAEQLGGDLEIEFRQGEGFLLSIDLPYPKRRKEDRK
ncbi:AAA family ATPase [Cohnella boryungensis]|uniref:AAA family ATPase n=1 Tax=Cohnella boryungensis TaxID=768479 RepID=A0ABV8S4I3_9BACL